MADKTRVLKGKNYELVNFCEFDKYATKIYCAVHGVDESLNLGDITKVDENKTIYYDMRRKSLPRFFNIG